jgi:hypothetical protein
MTNISSIDNMSIINLLDILGLGNDELISRNKIKEIINNKMKFAKTKKKQEILQKIYDKITTYLDKLKLNTIFRVDDLSLNKNLTNRDNEKFTIRNQAMKMDNAFLQTVAQGELNPLKKRTKSYILHINTKYRDKNSSELYDKQIMKSVKNTRHSSKIQQLLNNMINIKSIKITPDTINNNHYIFTLLLDVDIPADYLVSINNTIIYGYTKLDFILNEDISANNIFNTHNLTNITDIVKISANTLSVTVNLEGQSKPSITTETLMHRVNVANIPYTYVPDYGNDDRGKPITQSEYNAWDKSDNMHEYALVNRERLGLPPVQNYGTRRVFAPRTNNTTYTNYGNYEKNTVAVVINSGNPPLLSKQDTEHKDRGIYKEPNNNFTINLSSIFNNVIKMSMESFSFTNSIYTFSSMRKNNYFEIAGVPITIPDGTYSGEQLGIFLDNIINSKSSLLHAGYSKITGKLFFYDESTNDNPVNEFELVFCGNPSKDIINKNKINESVEKNAGWIMGFKRSYYKSYELGSDDDSKIVILNNNSSPKDTVTAIRNHYIEAESIYNEHSFKNLFLVVDDFNYNHYNNHYNSFNSDIVNSHILAKIRITTAASNNFSNIHDTMGDLEFRIRDYFGPVTIDRLNIKLIDEEGNVVDINETDYNLTLRFDSLHDI